MFVIVPNKLAVNVGGVPDPRSRWSESDALYPPDEALSGGSGHSGRENGSLDDAANEALGGWRLSGLLVQSHLVRHTVAILAGFSITSPTNRIQSLRIMSYFKMMRLLISMVM
jgi:hypothetical protein